MPGPKVPAKDPEITKIPAPMTLPTINVTAPTNPISVSYTHLDVYKRQGRIFRLELLVYLGVVVELVVLVDILGQLLIMSVYQLHRVRSRGV